MARKIPPDAFDAYFAMGNARSYEVLAKRYGVSKKAVTLIARRERWQERLVGLEAKAREASDKKITETLADRTERNLLEVRFIKAKALDALKRLSLDTAIDAARTYQSASREERVILGEPSDRTAISVEDIIKREYSQWLLRDGSQRKNGDIEWEEDDDNQLDDQPR